LAQEAAIPDLNALVVFAKVVEANSFSEAARRLQMPISTVSRRIAELEDELGVRLLDRSTRNLRLTELGAEVLEQAIHSAELSEAVDYIVSNRLSKVCGTLRLSAPPTISDTSLVAGQKLLKAAGSPRCSAEPGCPNCIKAHLRCRRCRILCRWPLMRARVGRGAGRSSDRMSANISRDAATSAIWPAESRHLPGAPPSC
jgi:DNA-binding MarR family transcriptional regulator